MATTYHTCTECDANFRSDDMKDGKMPQHKFNGKACIGGLTFEQFAAAYREAFRLLMSYTPNQVGSQVYAEQMAALADAHPEWAELVENE